MAIDAGYKFCFGVCHLVYSIIVPILIKLEESVEHARGKLTDIASETFCSIRMVVACGADILGMSLRVSQKRPKDVSGLRHAAGSPFLCYICRRCPYLLVWSKVVYLE